MMKYLAALPRRTFTGCLLLIGPLWCSAQQNPSSVIEPIDRAEAIDLVVETSQDNQTTRELIETLRQEIINAESSLDSFSNNIGELSFDLGNQLLKLSLYDEALESFRRAEHLLKINNGLYAMEQVPALEGLIQVNMRLRDWEAVDEDMDRLVWLYRRNESEESPKYLGILNEYAKYHLAAYFWNVDEMGLVHLIEAQDTLAYIADTSLQRGFDYDPLLYESLSITNYTLMGYATASDRYLDVAQLERRVGLGSYLANSYRRGLDYLRAGREVAYGSENLENRVHADLILADWYQLFLKRYEAQTFLLRAWETAKLIDRESSNDFVQPHVLPRQGYISLLPELQADDGKTRIAVRMDVDEWGSPRNVELATPPELLNSEALMLAGNRAIRAARQSRFRPVIVDGEPTEYVGFVHSVVLDN